MPPGASGSRSHRQCHREAQPCMLSFGPELPTKVSRPRAKAEKETVQMIVKVDRANIRGRQGHQPGRREASAAG